MISSVALLIYIPTLQLRCIPTCTQQLESVHIHARTHLHTASVTSTAHTYRQGMLASRVRGRAWSTCKKKKKKKREREREREREILIIHIHIHIHMHTNTYTHTQNNAHAHTHTQTHTYTHMHTHTHTHKYFALEYVVLTQLSCDAVDDHNAAFPLLYEVRQHGFGQRDCANGVQLQNCSVHSQGCVEGNRPL